LLASRQEISAGCMCSRGAGPLKRPSRRRVSIRCWVLPYNGGEAAGLGGSGSQQGALGMEGAAAVAKNSSSPLAERLTEVRDRIATAATKAGREAKDVTLVAVTKTAAPEQMREVVQLGVS